MKSVFYLIALLCPIMVYAQKPVLRSGEYEQWASLSLSDISADGTCLAYKRARKSGDSLYLYNCITRQQQGFAGAERAVFTPDGKFVCIAGGLKNQLLEIATYGKFTMENSRFIGFSANGDYALFFDPAINALHSVNLKTFIKKTIFGIVDVSLSPNAGFAALVRVKGLGQEVVLMDCNNGSIEEPGTEGPGFSGFSWSENGQTLAVLITGRRNSSYTVAAISRQSGRWITYTLTDGAATTGNLKITPSPLAVSRDGQLVYYYAKNAGAPEPGSQPDKKAVVYQSPSPMLRLKQNALTSPGIYWQVWHLKSGRVLAIETELYPNAVLTGDDKHAIIFNQNSYLPQHRYTDEYIDLSLLNLEDGEVIPLIKKQVYQPGLTITSPAGKYVAYYRETKWFIYDIKKRQHRCISNNIPHPVAKSDYDLPGAVPPYGCGGWTPDDRDIIIYDQYDIWMVNTMNGSTKKITDGRTEKVQSRIYNDGLIYNQKGKIFGFESRILSSPLLITTVNTMTLDEGIGVYDNGKLHTIVAGKRHFFSIHKALKANRWLYFESDFNQPPALCTATLKGGQQHIAMSNPDYAKYAWGKSELIKYTAGDRQLKGALYYPANYDPDKAYPMVVNIYERLSHTLHKFVPPDIGSDNGVNITRLSANGYFIFCPDIHYSVNNVGASALECVTAGVEAVLKSTRVNKAKIALIGHSFGGYQAAYIMGQSKLFCTAIIGAAVTDLRSFYLSFNGSGLPNMDLFYNYQFRMNAPFNSTEFEKNSPITYIENIKADLLLWTSDSDPVVDYSQTVMMYNAMWGLGKKCTLLLYPDEEHSLLERHNQVDLSTKIVEWLEEKFNETGNQPDK